MTAYQSFAVTKTGSSHIKEGKDCEDASFKDDASDAVIAVVADGHGEDNCFRSALGAKLAVDCAAKGMGEFIGYLNEPDPNELKRGLEGLIERLIKNKKPLPRKSALSKHELYDALQDRLVKRGVVPAWFKLVSEDLAKNPLTEVELRKAEEKHREQYRAGKDLHHIYGTTLIAAAITEDYFFGIHIGDGRCTALYKDGSFDQPLPWDTRCYLNVTTSLCDDDSAETARIYFCPKTEKDPPVAVFLCTDGVDDNFSIEGNERHLFKLYREIALTFADEGFDATCAQLGDLVNSFATTGKGDDTSVAGFIDMGAIKETASIWKKQITDEQALEAPRQGEETS